MKANGASAVTIAGSEAELSALAELQQTLAAADPRSLARLRSEIATTVASVNMLTQQSKQEAASASDRTSIAAISEATRRQVEDLSRDIYERRIFDPYLHFASAEDEAEYRRREAENKRYIDAELAKGTPEGALNASGGMQDQMLDAAAHGADQSPQFQKRWVELRETSRKQREALRAEGKSTEEYDKRIEDSVRRFLRSKGLTEAEIDAKIAAAGDDPLAAVEPYLASERDAQALDAEVGRATKRSEVAAALPDAEAAPAPEAKEAAASSVFAEFQTTGVRFTGEGSGHGLNGSNLRDRSSPSLPT